MSAVTARTIARYQPGLLWGLYGVSGKRRPRAALSNAEIARAIVTKLSQAKFPETTSHDWVVTMMIPASVAIGGGKKRNHGTTSCAKWLPSTSIRWSRFGRWGKYQLSGLGIGWVTWW